jgi:hypothetical protein
MQIYRDPRTYFAFIVGCVSYPPPTPPAKPLTKCVQDASDVRDCVLDLGYPPANVLTCLDPDHARLNAEFERFAQRLNGTVGATVVLFFAGHAVEDVASSVLLPIDGNLAGECWGGWADCPGARVPCLQCTSTGPLADWSRPQPPHTRIVSICHAQCISISHGCTTAAPECPRVYNAVNAPHTFHLPFAMHQWLHYSPTRLSLAWNMYFCSCCVVVCPDAAGTCMWLSSMHRTLMTAMHSGTIVTLVDACRVRPPSPMAPHIFAGGAHRRAWLHV